MTAGAEVNQLANVEGTHHALELAEAVGARRCTTSPRSPSPARTAATSPRTCSTSGSRSTTRTTGRSSSPSGSFARPRRMPWRIYRPSIVVGDSRTGRIDKVDGPYYFFPLLKRAHRLVPDWLPLVGPELGSTNLVPVDYVAAALDHIAHQPGLDGQAFHLTDPNGARVIDAAEHVREGRPERRSSPSRSTRGRWRGASRCRRGTDVAARRAPVRRALLAELGIPDEIVDYVGPDAPSSATERRSRRWRALGSRCRPCRAMPRSSGTTGRATSTPSSRNHRERHERRRRQDGADHRRLERHRARDGAAVGARRRDGAAGRARARAARGDAPRDRRSGRHRVHLPGRHLRPRVGRRADRARTGTSIRTSTSLSTTPGARSAARSRSPTTASTTSSAPCSSTTSARSG